MDFTSFILKLFVAIIGGMAIGFERQWNHKTTGLRNNILVAFGSCLFTLLSITILDEYDGDMTRVVGQIVTALGFFGAGLIFRHESGVKGLTSAVTLWCSGAIGCLAAFGLFSEAIFSTVMVVTLNSAIEPIDKWLKNRK